MTQRCPCHSGLPYAECCRPFHEGKLRPPSPTALMRSRYAAYTLGKVGYIMKTAVESTDLSPSERAAQRKAIKHFSQTTNFVGLQILGEEHMNEREATVTFRAILVQGGRDASYTERSCFERVNGRWFYRANPSQIQKSSNL